jgi:hypothetical protein
MPNIEIETFARNFREAVEPHWGPDTGSYSGDLFPEGYEVPPSGGQCVVTSAVLLGELRDALPNERFKLTVGAVVYMGRTILAHHTYVTHHPIMGRAPTVIDATADQAPGIGDKLIFGNMIELVTTRGLIYMAFNTYEQPPERICEDTPVPPGRTAARVALLRQRMGAWR